MYLTIRQNYDIHFIKFDTIIFVHCAFHARKKREMFKHYQAVNFKSLFDCFYSVAIDLVCGNSFNRSFIFYFNVFFVLIRLLLLLFSWLLVNAVCANWYNRQIFDEFQFNGMSFDVVFFAFILVWSLKRNNFHLCFQRIFLQ